MHCILNTLFFAFYHTWYNIKGMMVMNHLNTPQRIVLWVSFLFLFHLTSFQ